MILNKVRLYILKTPRKLKRFIVMIVDIGLCLLAVWLAYFLRIGEFLPLWDKYNEHYPLPACIVATLLSICIFNIFGLYKIVFRYTNSLSIINIGKAFVLYGTIFITIFTLIGINGVPRTLGIIQPLIFFFLIISSRFIAVYYLGNVYFKGVNINDKKQVLIYGAGKVGSQLASSLFKNDKVNVVGFLDNDTSFQGNKINNLNIYSPNEIDLLINNKKINEIIFALDEKKPNFYKKIMKEFLEKNITLRILPSYEDLLEDKINLNNIRDLSIDDVLGRKVVAADPKLMKRDIYNKIVLVSGAGGSIGSELCRQISKQNPKKLILLDHSEYSLYKISEELKKLYNTFNKIQIITSLSSVTNKDAIKKLLKNIKPDTIFHTAAYKHVHLVEENKIEGLYNNIFGTVNLSQAAIDSNVKKFVLISTDKAVRPSSIMGASKRIAEMIMQALSTIQNKTLFSIVRFGNVLESSGSVVPLFKSQIKSGGPVTVTHPNASRYFMTLTEAAELVIQASAMTTKYPKPKLSAPIYLLEMGKPVKILDLAKLMIKLSGLTINNNYNKNGDIKIKITGLRQGEKLHEELLINGIIGKTNHPKIKFINEPFLTWTKLENILIKINQQIKERDDKVLEETVLKLITTADKS